MYSQIKKLADEAIALQNKDRMDAVLREISALCAPAAANRTFAENVAAVTGGKVVDYGEPVIIRSTTPPMRAIISNNKVTKAICAEGQDEIDALHAQFVAAGAGDVQVPGQPGDAVQITGIENTETGESKVLNVKAQPVMVALPAETAKNEFPKEFAPKNTMPRTPAKKGGAK